jgi:DNA-directed RNA polymerase subunit RPC12/RpoP
MDITFKCPHCDQELEVDASGAGSEIECPACSNSITVPVPEPAEVAAADARAAAPPPPPAPAKEEKHFAVPVHQHAPETLIKKSTAKALDIIAKEGDKTLRIKTIKRSDCQEVGKDHFDETVSAFLEKVGQLNIVSIHPINYSFMELSTRHILTDYGVMIVFKG